ncbi:hypothetical protein NQ318_003765 [Aromia moschata]|uniref:Uncharacterized protein n=1 Tax=Aromia moschata TaxID=1265417 RepID=A0AAV8YHT4_9CUCU|nr:hypothetical protein NQ318_003765 [Aromia moschata]
MLRLIKGYLNFLQHEIAAIVDEIPLSERSHLGFQQDGAAIHSTEIKSRQQRRNESLQEYEADIERLVHLAYPQAPKEFLEQIGIQTFIDGLLDTEMQQGLRLGRHTTISDVLVAALEFKTAKEASGNYKPKVRQVIFDDSQSLKETIEKIMRETLNGM